jgi:tRNA threonylcarbamoyladenosine biosynthesis protein TsaE
MNEFRFVYKLTDIQRTAKNFLDITKDFRHIAFYGGMGVGKTTFITEICRILGTIDLVSSPTFAIINEYETSSGLPIFHFDFYRIKSPVELLDIGFNEYCSANAFCFIEWPDRAEEIIPDDFLRVNMKELNHQTRIVEFTL